MNSFKIAILLCLTGVFAMIVAPSYLTPNVVKAYSCSSSSSIHAIGASSSVSGSSDSCATTASSSSSTPFNCAMNCVLTNPPPPNGEGTAFQPIGAGVTFSGGGSQSSCLSVSANQNAGGLAIGAFPQQGSCTSHSP